MGWAQARSRAGDPLTMRMMAHLKRLFRANGLRYADVADMLGVSEKSVKRYMGGRGVTLAVLEKLCASAGVTVLELAHLADADDAVELVPTTDRQEEAMAADPKLAIAFYLLGIGWTAARMLREFGMTEADLTALLIRLDRLGLIALFPANRVKMRATLRQSDLCSPGLQAVLLAGGTELVTDVDLADGGLLWRVGIVRLGPASFARATKRYQDFVEEIAELGRQDLDLDGRQVRWYGVCALLREHEAPGLRMLRGQA